MASYDNSNFKVSNVNYLNKDFASLKTSLINYAKSYFPDTYRDFNETSPGMMLLEMNAYVGDVLSFYVDQQYKEMLLPLAEERRNIINMAKMFGYKVKPIVPAYVDLTFTSEVNAMSQDTSKVDYSDAGVFSEGLAVPSATNSEIFFTTLEPVDFTISASNDTAVIGSTDGGSGLISSFNLSRTVRAVSSTEKQISVQVGVPEKFTTITLPDTNVIDIISCIDSNGNNWYEVDFLAQDKVPISTHYLNEGRTSAYQNLITGEKELEAVPYSLTYIKTPKRFTRETNTDNTTSLVFGNGILKSDQLIDDSYIDMEQVGVIVPGQYGDINTAIDPLLGDEYSTLGEAPNNTTLTITYRIGGGISSNVNANNLNTLPTTTAIGGNLDAELISVNNNFAARGGKNLETIEEIRQKTKAFFTTQNRCVTKEDYEARVLNMPAKFGNIAKVYVSRNVEGNANEAGNTLSIQAGEQIASTLINIQDGTEKVQTLLNAWDDCYDNINNVGYSNTFFNIVTTPSGEGTAIGAPVATRQQLFNAVSDLSSANVDGQSLSSTVSELTGLVGSGINLSSVNIYVLAYNNQKELVGNPMVAYQNATITDYVSTGLMSNIKNYLNNFKLLTDFVELYDGYIVNFAVWFDVTSQPNANKQQVKLNCINRIINYFSIDKMQFNQPIYLSELEFELMSVDGVRTVNHVTIHQEFDYKDPNNPTSGLQSPTYLYSYSDEVDSDNNPDNGISGGFREDPNGTVGYGYKYDFEDASADDGVIRPPQVSTPTVFELKKPNQNIKGVVR